MPISGTQQHQRECDEGQCDGYDADHERFVAGVAGAAIARHLIILNAIGRYKKAAPVRRGD